MTRRIPALDKAELTEAQRQAPGEMRRAWGEPWNIGMTLLEG